MKGEGYNLFVGLILQKLYNSNKIPCWCAIIVGVAHGYRHARRSHAGYDWRGLTGGFSITIVWSIIIILGGKNWEHCIVDTIFGQYPLVFTQPYSTNNKMKNIFQHLLSFCERISQCNKTADSFDRYLEPRMLFKNKSQQKLHQLLHKQYYKKQKLKTATYAMRALYFRTLSYIRFRNTEAETKMCRIIDQMYEYKQMHHWFEMNFF